MKKGQRMEGIVERVEFPDKGIVRTETGEHVVVKNTIPGQRVSFSINKVRRGKAEGRLHEVLERASAEQESACVHFGRCGGCSYQTLPYDSQLELKDRQLRALFEPVLGVQFDEVYEGIRRSPRQFGYRNKMEFSFGDEYKGGPLALGMHRRGSFYDLVTVDHCQIMDEDFRRVLAATLAYFREKGTPYYHRMSHVGYLRHLLVRKAVRTGEILVDLVTSGQERAAAGGTAEPGTYGIQKREATGAAESEIQEREAGVTESGIQKREATGTAESGIQEREAGVTVPGTQEMGERLLELAADNRKALISGWCEVLLKLERSGQLEGHFAGILHTVNDSIADVIKNEETQVLYGKDSFYEEILGLRFKISAFSFFQTNSLGAEVLYETVREFILDGNEGALEGKLVYDLYSGTGTIAQMLAPVCRKAVGVEIVEEAVEAAKTNAAENHLENCVFLTGDVLKVLDTIDERPDYIILDPPRAGIHPKALERIVNYGVERLVYVSCMPTSLVRDLEVFLRRGYVVERMVGVDMFAGTGNIETVCLLSKLHSDQHIEVELKMDELDLTAVESKGAYEEIKDYVLK